ncbi:stage II sporulation protein M [Gracilibacillus boraciitolerans]|nr:stage II sporulation protein M [Gracilibacillus boraciitolerans]
MLLFFLGMFFPMDIGKDEGSVEISFNELFFHNLRAQFTSILLGIMTLGIYSLFYMFLNFLLLGMVVTTLNQTESLIDVVQTIIFHGFFEIPAMLLSITLGIFTPWKIILMIKNKNFNFDSLRVIFSISILIVILTIIAAFIESLISQNML